MPLLAQRPPRILPTAPAPPVRSAAHRTQPALGIESARFPGRVLCSSHWGCTQQLWQNSGSSGKLEDAVEQELIHRLTLGTQLSSPPLPQESGGPRLTRPA